MDNNKIQCVLYDLDGVLVDACHWHYIALNTSLFSIASIIIGEEEHNTVFNGLPTHKKLQFLVSQKRIKEEQVDKIWKLKQKLTIDTIKKFASIDQTKIELHETLTNLNIPFACVTNSIKETAELMLEKTGQLKYMKFVISNEDVLFPKPRAEGYINAMIKMGVFPKNTLIVEDSEKGLQAANDSCANILHVKNATEVTAEIVYNKILELNGVAK